MTADDEELAGIAQGLAGDDPTTQTTTDTDTAVPDWLLPDRVYDALKWLGLIVFPALAVLVSTIGPAWGIPATTAIVTTLNAIGVLCGSLIGVSALNARRVNR